MSDAQFVEIMTGEKGFAGGGTGPAQGPNVWTDPRFADLPLDQKQSFANAAANAAEQQRTAMAANSQLERNKFLDQAYNAGYQNDPAIVEALKGSVYWDAEAQAKFNAGQEVFRKSEAGSAEVGSKLTAGIPLAAGDGKDLARWFGEDSFAGLAAGNQDAYDKLKWAVNQGGLLPDGTVDVFRKALANPESAPTALAWFAAANIGDPSLLRRSGFTQDDIAQVQLFGRLAQRRGDLDTAMKDYQSATDTQKITGKTPDQLQTESAKLFNKSYPDASAVVSKFSGWFSGALDTQINPRTESQLMADASTAFHLRYGNEDAANAYMETYLEQTWGVSQTKLPAGRFTWGAEGQKGVLMRNPPEKYYTGSEGDLGYLYTALSEYAVAGGATAYGAVLVPDDVTDREVREGKFPTYQVIGMDEFGGAIVLPGRFGGDALQAGQDAFKTDDALRANATKGLSAVKSRLVELDSEIEFARNRGADSGQVMALEREKATLGDKLQGDTLAAVENGYLSPGLIADPVGQAAFVKEKLATDPTVTQRIAALTKARGTVQGMSQTEANRIALAYIIQKDFKLTEEAANAIVDSLLETSK
jgi:hypothetical protein